MDRTAHGTAYEIECQRQCIGSCALRAYQEGPVMLGTVLIIVLIPMLVGALSLSLIADGGVKTQAAGGA